MLLDLLKSWLFSPVRLAAKVAFWIFLLVVIGGIVFLLTFDLNNYKQRIEEAASSFLQDELKIDGDVKLGMDGLRPSLVFHDVKVGQDGKTTVVLSDRLEVEIPLQKPGKDPFSLFATLENIRIDGKAIGDYGLPLRISSDGIDIPKIEGDLDNARIKGHFRFLQGKIDAKIVAKDLDYAHLAEGIEGGKIIADIVLSSSDAGIKNVNGHILLSGGKGSLAGNALNFWAGDLLTSILRGRDKETKITCTLAHFDVKSGVAISKAVIIETERVTVFGKGIIDFNRGYVDMKFTPKPKTPALVSLETPVVVRAAFGNIKASPDSKAVMEKLGGLLLGTVAPPVALLTFAKSGTLGDTPCAGYLEKP